MAVRWGKNLAAGRRTDEFVSLTDLAPTFLQLAGLKIPEVMTGRSFVNVLLDQPSQIQRNHVFLERECHDDLNKDPHQIHNIAGIREYAASQKMLRTQVEQWMRDTADLRVDPKFNGWDNYPDFGTPIVEMRENQRKPKARTPNP